ncbi:MAG TPA: CPBP family intramembrane glutamic endopeptidase [Blastocatellia bacterium]|nr:CPBP family intramembrane glutamic endopeptidase [Blastocatellia bacterium]
MISQDQTQTAPAANNLKTAGARGLPLNVFWIYVVAFFAVWSVRALIVIRIDDSIQSPLGKNVFSNTVKFVIWVLPVFVTLAICRLRPFDYLKLSTPVNKRGLLPAMVVITVWLSLAIIGESIISGKSIGAILSQRSADWLSILAGVAVSPIWEEILFRGFFLNRLNESLSFWVANVISALLFVAVHMPYWVSRNGFSPGVTKNLVNVFLLGCVFGWIMKQTNSLWPAIGAHIANNFVSVLIHG